MNIDDWLQWPTKSTDPGVNFVVLIVLAALVMLALVTGAVIAVPVLIVIALAKGVHWYVHRPMPTDQLHAQTQQRVIAANFPAADAFLQAHVGRLLEAFGDDPPAYSIYLSMVRISQALYGAEDLNNPLPPIPPRDTIEEGRYRDNLILHLRKSEDAPRTLNVITSTLSAAYLQFIEALPPIAKTTREKFAQTDEWEPFATFPLVDLLPDTGRTVRELIAPFFADEIEELRLFTQLRRQLERNVHEASGVAYPAPSEKLILPDRHKGSPREIVSAYLHSAPFEALFYAPIPLEFSDQQRFEHTHVVGGSGHGKTQLLQRIILNDLQRPDPPSLIIIDSQGEMLRKIQKLQCFASGHKLADRLIVIDPEDVAYPPALNMFASPSTRLAGYSQGVKEQVEAGTIELFNYIFGAIAAELTSRQNTTFAFVTRLMLAIPDATIHTLRELFEDGATSIDASPFGPHIRALDATSQGFFDNQFFTKAYSQTKAQIARRLYGVLQVPSFDRMFSARDNKLDMFEAMQSGTIVLVNTSKALLKSDASALFGRYMIARVIAAAFERIALPLAQRKPAFLIVDEAAEYVDENLETLLSQARKFNVGVLFAHQHLDQLSPALRASVAANTSIKLAGGVSDRDARALAADMRTSAEFIAGMTKRARSTEFACFVRNYTGNAVRLEVPFGILETAPTMSPSAQDEVLARNRARYAIGPAEPRPVAVGPDTAPPVTAGDDWRS